MVEDYKNTLKNVQLAVPVLYSDMIKYVCDLAEKELGIKEGLDG
jgi:hypothetical protein